MDKNKIYVGPIYKIDQIMDNEMIYSNVAIDSAILYEIENGIYQNLDNNDIITNLASMNKLAVDDTYVDENTLLPYICFSSSYFYEEESFKTKSQTKTAQRSNSLVKSR